MDKERYSVSVYNLSQLYEAIKYKIDKIYVPFDLFYSGDADIDLIDKVHRDTNIKIYVSLPRILRLRDQKYIDSFKDFILKGKIDGVQVKNLESIAIIEELKERLNKEFISVHGKTPTYTTLYIDGDSSLYTWNKQALIFNKQYCDLITAPLELSFYEIMDLDDRDMIIPVYGKAPLMISANCIKKTSGNCNHKSGFEFGLKDRKNKVESVYSNCTHCFNEVFNNVPTSYHGKINDFMEKGYYNFVLNFVNESGMVISKVLNYYINEKRKGKFPIEEYTTGHITKGAL